MSHTVQISTADGGFIIHFGANKNVDVPPMAVRTDLNDALTVAGNWLEFGGGPTASGFKPETSGIEPETTIDPAAEASESSTDTEDAGTTSEKLSADSADTAPAVNEAAATETPAFAEGHEAGLAGATSAQAEPA